MTGAPVASTRERPRTASREGQSPSLFFVFLASAGALAGSQPAAYLPAHLNVEEDVAPIKTFIHDTNCIIMKRHGFTVLGRTVSEAYHRTCVLCSEVKRNIIVEQLCAAKGTKPDYFSKEEMEWMFRHGDAVVYPEPVRRR